MIIVLLLYKRQYNASLKSREAIKSVANKVRNDDVSC